VSTYGPHMRCLNSGAAVVGAAVHQSNVHVDHRVSQSYSGYRIHTRQTYSSKRFLCLICPEPTLFSYAPCKRCELCHLPLSPSSQLSAKGEGDENVPHPTLPTPH
jgi:hypothetical protein